MKFFIGVIKPFRLDEVRETLTGLGIQGLTVSEVKDLGRQRAIRIFIGPQIYGIIATIIY